MSDDWMDWAEDERASELFEQELRAELRRSFTETPRKERFKEMLMRLVMEQAHPGFELLREAEGVLAISPRCALLMAFASIEVSAKQLMIQPALGSFADHRLLTELAARLTSKLETRVWSKAALDVVLAFEPLDATPDRRPGSERSLTSEVNGLGELRNQIIHAGRAVSREEAQGALALANFWHDRVLGRLATLHGIIFTRSDPHSGT